MDDKLFQEFPPVPTEKWEEIIQKDLKGGDYDKKLVWKTLEGFPVRPYYRRSDLAKTDYLKSNPGEFPFTRGTGEDNRWKIRQDIFVDNILKANEIALNAIRTGATSLCFIFKKDIDDNDFFQLMKDINPEDIEINFADVNLSTKYTEMLAAFVDANNYDSQKVCGSNDCDRLGYGLLHGNRYCDTHPDCETLDVILTKHKNRLPGFKFITVNAKNYGNAGGSTVQETAFALAEGAEYLRLLSDKGLPIDDIAPKIRFNFSIGSNYFMEIAKLRAARLLWAKIVKANSPKDEDSTKMDIHCETAMFNKTAYDPFVNMLRVTTEAMSAVIGGTNSLTVLPYDLPYELPTDFSYRIARNVQLIIKEEAYFDKVVDPAAGSYYVENLTDAIVEHAWQLFLDVDAKGGFLEATKSGYIQDVINATADIRRNNIATRREILLGTNQYPNFSETKPEFSPVVTNCEDESRSMKTIRLFRLAEEFETLRSSVARSGRQPVAFMLTIGNLNMRKARSQFSCNFFACAGFEVIDNNGFATIDEGMNAARNKAADIVVLCSSDDEYADLAPQAQQLVGDKILVIAGNPACKGDLEKCGIKNFIHVKTNVLSELQRYCQLLGIGK